MNLPTACLLMVFCSIICGAGKTPPDEKADTKPATFEELAEEFYSNVSSPAGLTLSITDQATLTIALKKLKERQKRISELAKVFRKMPVPDKERQRKVNNAMEKRDEARGEKFGDSFEKHLLKMPRELLKQWRPALQAFYQNLDQDQETFARYFGKPDEKE